MRVEEKSLNYKREKRITEVFEKTNGDEIWHLSGQFSGSEEARRKEAFGEGKC